MSIIGVLVDAEGGLHLTVDGRALDEHLAWVQEAAEGIVAGFERLGLIDDEEPDDAPDDGAREAR